HRIGVVLSASFIHGLADRVVDLTGLGLVHRLADRVAVVLRASLIDRLAGRVVARANVRLPHGLANRVLDFTVARLRDVLHAIDRLLLAHPLKTSLVAGVLALFIDDLLAGLHHRASLLRAALLTAGAAAGGTAQAGPSRACRKYRQYHCG